MMMCVLISDSTLTTVNVTSVMELVKNWDSLSAVVIGTVDIIPRDRLDAIRSSCSTNKKIASQCASYYVHCHPRTSWTHLTSRLYEKGQFKAVEKCKPFLPLRGKYKVVTYTLLVCITHLKLTPFMHVFSLGSHDVKLGASVTDTPWQAANKVTL